jgi:hypothetical protein
MQKQLGLWIDHRKAVLITLADGTESSREIISGLEKRPRFADNPRAKLPDKKNMAVNEDTRDRQFENQLEKFYMEVFSQIKDSSAIWIIGPGEAKCELEKFIKDHGQGSRLVGIEPSDKLSLKQLASKVRQYFNVKR